VDKEIGPQILAAFSSIVRRTRALETADATMGDVPSSVIGVLALLSDNGELRLSAVAAGLALDASVVSRTVAVAEQRGLVSRRPDPRDGRACLLSLTEHGSQCLATRRNKRLSLLSSGIDGWEPGAAEALLAGLTRLRDGLARTDNASSSADRASSAHRHSSAA
jgi:DNA-binding MarR family transcriptional regulator